MRAPYDQDLGVSGAVTPSEVARALEENPRAKAVLIVSPTYFGGAADSEKIAALCRARGVPLLVDEAHGPHLHFHPDLPASALSAGADMVVQSTHKIISGMTQASLLHIKGPRVDRARARKALELIQSTSPSYVLMASLDAARRQMALSGETLLGQAIELAEEGRRRLSDIPGLRVFGRERRGRPELFDLDVTKLTVNVTGLGMTGFEAKRRLNEEHSIQAEMATLHNVLLIVTIGNRMEDIERAARAFEALCEGSVLRGSFGDPPKAVWLSPPEALPPMRLSPREAFFAEHARVPFERAAGATSALGRARGAVPAGHTDPLAGRGDLGGGDRLSSSGGANGGDDQRAGGRAAQDDKDRRLVTGLRCRGGAPPGGSSAGASWPRPPSPPDNRNRPGGRGCNRRTPSNRGGRGRRG
jgi:arginine decarboxylase